MNIKQTIIGATLILASSGAYASIINVGGVTWNPASGSDFKASGALYESFAAQPGDSVTGFGKITQFNNAPESAFCPGCELTFTFSFDLVSGAPTADLFDDPDKFDFALDNAFINFYVDSAKNYGLLDANFDEIPSSFSTANASDGQLFLTLQNHGLLTGTATDLFTQDLILGTGTGFFDAIGGLAFGNFDTNTFSNGADISFESGFGAIPTGPNGNFVPAGGFGLTGSMSLQGNTIPEPTSLALLGIGLLGFGASRARKQA